MLSWPEHPIYSIPSPPHLLRRKELLSHLLHLTSELGFEDVLKNLVGRGKPNYFQKAGDNISEKLCASPTDQEKCTDCEVFNSKPAGMQRGGSECGQDVSGKANFQEKMANI